MEVVELPVGRTREIGGDRFPSGGLVKGAAGAEPRGVGEDQRRTVGGAEYDAGSG